LCLVELLSLLDLDLPGLGETCVGGHAGIFLAKISQDTLAMRVPKARLAACISALIFGISEAKFLAERRAIELKQTLDVILGKV